ncbi:hypothetical protein QYE76_065473 [Lolium multiflorum]|uniref:DUF3615 domain-containing protein n=1 Tax=Lolium multiflorum TaxID=4521 RepID=A0AAD8SAD4_LOLMU|nr:hypothetical protein QYE76_065473 [Lolium multiflorum]
MAVNMSGFYHTYPVVRGPFKTLQEADNAIHRHLHDLEDPKMSSDSLDKLSLKERAVRESLYWPDGTRRNCLEPPDESHDEIHLLVEALVDQYNEDHNLLEDRALQLKAVQRQRFFFSKGDQYYHFNFTARTEGVVDSFFAEVQCIQGDHEEMVVTCFCVVKTKDNGRCYGCQNNGAVDMKHPKKANAYCRGQVDEYMPILGGYHIDQNYLAESDDDEEWIRSEYEFLDDPIFMAEHFPNSEHADLPPSAQRLDKLRGKTTLKESPVTAISSPILVRKPEDWSSDSLDKLSLKERVVRESLYWPDGTRKKCLEPPDESEDEVHLLLEALVDQYNEDHYLLGNHALQLKDVQRERFFFSKGNTYNHFNFTARTEGVIDSFFAEVQCTDDGEHEEIVVSCFCVVKPNDNGRCYGCQNNGAVDMKHPNKANAYCRGQVDEYMPCLGGYHLEQSYLTESVEDEEERLRSQYECFDDPSFMAEHFPYS